MDLKIQIGLSKVLYRIPALKYFLKLIKRGLFNCAAPGEFVRTKISVIKDVLPKFLDIKGPYRN